MPTDPTSRQSASSRRTAGIARAARSEKAAARRAEAEAQLAETYRPVDEEVAGALEALQSRSDDLAMRRIRAGQLLLASIAATGKFDPVRHRAAMTSLREASRDLVPRSPR